MSEYYKCIPSELVTDFEQFYSQVANLLPDNCVVAECGISNGRSGIMLAEMLSDMRKNFTLYLVDNMAYGGPQQRNDVIGHIVNSGMGNRIKLLEMSSLDASCQFPDGHFDFVFLDSSHKFEPTKAEIRAWYYKIKEEGWLAGHDYFSKENPEVAMAVNEVIPETFTRATIPDQQSFLPEKLLYTEQTRNGNGIWFVQKRWWVKLN